MSEEQTSSAVRDIIAVATGKPLVLRRPNRSTYNKRMAEEICKRVAAGESLRAIFNGPIFAG